MTDFAAKFRSFSVAELIGQLRLEARQKLDPEFEAFLSAVADRLATFASPAEAEPEATGIPLAFEPDEWVALTCAAAEKAREWEDFYLLRLASRIERCTGSEAVADKMEVEADQLARTAVMARDGQKSLN